MSWKTGSTQVDGTYSRLEGNGFSAKNQQCVVYAVLSHNANPLRQIEAGVLRCDNWVIDGTCSGGTTVVETFNGSKYVCTPGYAFDNNTLYDATTYRQGANSTTFYGHINGASATLGGFGVNDQIQGFAWGEAAGATGACPAPSRGTFTLWKKYFTGPGWSYVSGSLVHSGWSAMPSAPCWSPSSVSSTGGFDVD